MARGKDWIEFDEEKIDAIFSGMDRSDEPGFAVGVALRGVPVYRRGFGLANAELPITLTSATSMRIGSVSKHMVALAFLLLCEEGKADLGAPVGSYIPALHPVSGTVPIRHLLAHTSGLRDAFDLCWQFNGMEARAETGELLEVYRTLDSVNAPTGAAWIYNNGGYLLVSEAIERISGKPLEDFLLERIFGPLGMTATRLQRRDTVFGTNRASCHVPIDGGFERPVMGTAFSGEGGIVSSIDDMLRWLAHMSNPSLGRPATWRMLAAPQCLRGGGGTGYGFGLALGEHEGQKLVFHGGRVLGGTCHMLKAPRAELDIVVIANRHDVDCAGLARSVLARVLGGDARPLRTGIPMTTGAFRSSSSGRVVQLLQKEGKQVMSLNGSDIVVRPDAAGALRPAAPGSHLNLSLTLKGPAGEPRALCLSDCGVDDELRPVKPYDGVDLPNEVPFKCQPAGVAAVISTKGGRPFLKTTGRFGSTSYDLEALGARLWRARDRTPLGHGGVLYFDETMLGFHFSSARTHRLAFSGVTA